MRVISGNLKGRLIKGFTIDGTRPTMDRVKESIFASIQSKIPNSTCLDLFAGSGSLGIEAISNGANKVYFVDNNSKVTETINKTVNDFSIQNQSIILNSDYKKALNYFKDNNITFDVIFIDPPYKMHIINEILLDISNFNLINIDGVVICEVDNDYLKENISNFKMYKIKKYGSTFVKFYKN